MPSPPFPGSPSPTTSPSFSDPLLYRRMDYRHGNVVRITESRRRSPVASSPGPNQSIPSLHLMPRETPVTSSSKSLKAPSPLVHSHLIRSSQQYRHQGSTKTSKSSSKSKAQVVIVQGPISVSVDFQKRNAVPHVSVGMYTPPPTPQISRLATPELNDLEDRSFCECCTNRTAKYCAGCGYELGRCGK